MAETAGLSPDLLGTELSRIEHEVDSGNRDLKALGFWKLLARVKRDPELVKVAAESAGRIDAKAFDVFTKLRFPVWLGNLILLLGIAVGAFCVSIAHHIANVRVSSHPISSGSVAITQTVHVYTFPDRLDLIIAGILLIAAAGIWSVAVHCPAHWAIGRAIGIRFRCYFFGGPFPPRPGLKTDYSTYLRARPRDRALMHASGALATKVAPFVVLAFWFGSDAPAWAAWVVLAIGIVQILTDVFLSTKSSDWKKVKRELAVARSYTGREGSSGQPG